MDEDLYGDLDTSTSALARTEVLQQKQRVDRENDRLRAELAELQLQNRRLGERNRTLETNISTLFVTAQHELKRKDTEIQRLREALERSERQDKRPPPRDRSSECSRDGRRESSYSGNSSRTTDASRELARRLDSR